MKLILTAILTMLCWIPTRAQILLTINDSDSSHVTFTATGTAPFANPVGGLGGDVDLVHFFSTGESNGNFAQDAGSTLATSPIAGFQSFFIQAQSDTYSSGGFLIAPALDLDLYGTTNSTGASNVYQSNVAAFVGSATFDFTGVFSPGDLPSAGTTGAIVAGDSFDLSYGTAPITIGEWEVVATPEPSSWILGTGSVALFFYLRRRQLETSVSPQEISSEYS
jgi:hypothetical protein